ncbi:MAG: deoxynucleoside kinase [Anaerolineae bacterium]|nr:deoxynucleoside kinase [Anaerolineae bacterium]
MTLPLDIFVVGNIACGKTTLGRLLAEQIAQACFVPEPHDKNPFLPLYLCDQTRWGFTSTLYYYLGYARAAAEVSAKNPSRYCFIDAGTWSNALLYAEYLRGEEVISRDEFDFYQQLRLIIDQAYPRPAPTAFIFVHLAPSACYERMKRRGWSYQTPITIEYIEILQGYLEKMRAAVCEMGIAVLDISSGEIDFTQPHGQRTAVQQVEHFLRTIA